MCLLYITQNYLQFIKHDFYLVKSKYKYVCIPKSVAKQRIVAKQSIVAKQRMPKVAKVGNIDRHGIPPQ